MAAIKRLVREDGNSAMTCRSAIAFASLVVLLGCASSEKPGLFTTEIGGFDVNTPTYFPALADQEVPRYRFLGELRGDENFIRERAKSTALKAIEWITGAVFGAGERLSLKRPQSGVVSADGRILVSDVGRGGVFAFDTAGGVLAFWDYALQYQRFESPIGVAASKNGDVFVADSALGLVAHLDVQGRPMAPIGSDILTRPTGVVLDETTNELFVADTGAHEIVVFDLEGYSVKRRLGGPIGANNRLNFPTFMAISSGELYVADTMNARVAIIDAQSGKLLRHVGERGVYIGQLVRPKGIALDREQNLYVVESFHDHLLVYDPEGRFLLPISSGYYLPSGVWTDERDRVYLADTFNGRVLVFQFLGGEN